MRIISFVFIVMMSISCGKEANVAIPADIAGYVQETIPGTSAVRVMKKAGDKVSESGYVMNGSKVGEWTTYDNDGKIKTITNYIDGKKNGRYLEYSNRGQIELIATYQNDVYHGAYGKYKFGRVTEEMNYKYAQLDGEMKTYFNTGKIQKLITFKNGKQDGDLKYYDEEGNVTLEYQYKDGEKISGGLLEK